MAAETPQSLTFTYSFLQDMIKSMSQDDLAFVTIAAIGIAIASSAFQPHLDVVLKRLEFEAACNGLGRSATVKRVNGLTSSFLTGGALNFAAVCIAFVTGMDNETYNALVVAFVLAGFFLYVVAFLLYLVRMNIFDPGMRLLGMLAVSRVPPR